MTVYQISVFLENRTGQLAEITQILADNQINMCAISIAETSDYGVLRLIVDQPQKTTSILLEKGFILSKTPVTAVMVPDRPGGLAPVLQLIAEGEIDVEYMYSLFTHKAGNAYMVFRVSDNEKFTALLSQNGIHVADRQELGIGD
ncbi:ACT domain-containing protein [Agathobaculum sp. Marseille-P7918]|uniref:ACT domain-containing protein n=1 Tax=Agathobaculum sp. Marseille-P7918 TaxID=2479843 RepID=UPI000F62E934|nr:ACT domain-containing protein [Agathobaculum sp. Marseille-P7918]